jgi:hypothetical protein
MNTASHPSEITLTEANRRHDQKFGISRISEYWGKSIRSTWNERHALMGKPLTDRKIAKYQEEGVYEGRRKSV